MRCAVLFIRRVAFPVLIHGIVGGLWFAADAAAQREQFDLLADELAQPIGHPPQPSRLNLQLVLDDLERRRADDTL